MQRRDFLKFGCTGCLLTATGLISVSALLESCGSTGGGALAVHKAEAKNRQVIIPQSLFVATDLRIVRVKGAAYDLGVHKSADGVFTALEMKCTHFDNPIISTGRGYVCNSHGSLFGMDGKVEKGPASKPLKQYAVRAEGENIIIAI